ncbi:MAG: hypothetical protein EOM65_04610 [Synergistales bacterium]|jgi:L-serine deaminase|nr:hypothetical protein [Synergistales bacterium]
MEFLDIVGPVMIGPTSSHTAGAAMLGKPAKACREDDPFAEAILFLRGSFAFTSKGHGTDKALVAGLPSLPRGKHWPKAQECKRRRRETSCASLWLLFRDKSPDVRYTQAGSR